ncbi:FtsK/SpoIIIE family DNA translocase [Salisediminibacterium halotolerans]|uniref:FtsK/SpoIIIE family DNA translocase n=1 Tax=Salisediminibacterium halotolerans TaxID=517425 RepID=UPI000EACD59A|nr:DNA translocase FtsK [Salisediminibacterium halotolerans]RLJ74165.1 DNA translocase FtsK [Actinophytocola xinjiangensis]RPE87742.1 DNA translocase FtsK [Salisediminibacterium halotolerans]TWG35002.1 DNA translocase FtsK [Salisediminibacterium halotolerans]GEL06711.1 DNA translocase SpoIIIE [Salisediminibacterium halotolerans]
MTKKSPKKGKSSAKKQTKNEETAKRSITYELTGLFIFILSVIGIFQFGVVGQFLASAVYFSAGNWAWLFAVLIIWFSLYVIAKRSVPAFLNRRLIGVYLFTISFLLISHARLYAQLPETDRSVVGMTWDLFWNEGSLAQTADGLGGGMIGALLFSLTNALIALGGTYVLAGGLLLASLIFLTGKTLVELYEQTKKEDTTFYEAVADKCRRAWQGVGRIIANRRSAEKNKRQAATESTAAEPVSADKKENATEEEPVIYDFTHQLAPPAEGEIIDVPAEPVKTPAKTPSAASENNKKPAAGNGGSGGEMNEEKSGETLVVRETENADYILPSMDLLASPGKPSQSGEHAMLSKNARKLESTLESFGVKAKVSKVHLGPSVTKYEVHPETGVRVNKIVNLSDDIALALAAKDVRMEAPIPGKSAIGIEVPNQEVSLVSLREVLESKEMKQKTNPLAIALGRDISGEAVIAELNKMPHLLVAGATGSGKSVCINGIITSILMRAKPHEVKLMMIDPKMVELNVYNGIPHLLSPVVTEPKRAAQALKKVVSEMERRYELFAASGTRNLEGYNQHIAKENEYRDAEEAYSPLPYIVVIVDELADLMMVASSEVEDAITRLAQMARAAGIHMIIATQRPSVDVITGVIKANIPSRIAFGVSSATDSRTILDSNGAEKLLGKGDMLFIPVGSSKSTRVQGAFLADEEVERIVGYCIEQQKAQYSEEMAPAEADEQSAAGEVDDELYDDAVALVMQMQSASVSMIQRRFRVGYARAARLIDEMEVRGIVGPYEGSKPREVLVDKDPNES